MSVWRRILLFPLTRLVLFGLVFGVLAGLFTGLVHLGFSLLGGLRTPPWAGITGPALASVVTLLLMGRFVERRSVAEVGLGARHALRDTLLGFVIGGLLLAAVIGLMALGGWYRIEGPNWSTAYFWTALYMTMLVGINEEVLLRGVFFRVLEESLGSWISLALSALLFGLLHLGNPNATLTATLAIALEAGILLAAAYMLTRSLWLAIGIHWGWNFVQGPVFGAAVSGGESRGLVRSVIAGPAWATGGDFGPEASLFAVLLCTAAGVLFLVLSVRRNQVVAPFWRRRSHR